MSSFIPSGYVKPDDALDRIGRWLFPNEWTGDETDAPVGMLSPKQAIERKKYPSSGGGAPGGAGRMGPSTGYRPPPKPTLPEPETAEYEALYAASLRRNEARLELQRQLESGKLRARSLDPWTGAMHALLSRTWRRHDAERLLSKGQAPIPQSNNFGTLLIEVEGLPDDFEPHSAKDAENKDAERKPPTVAKLTDWLNANADGQTPEPEMRQRAEEHYCCRIPLKSVWRPAWRNIPKSLKLSRGVRRSENPADISGK